MGFLQFFTELYTSSSLHRDVLHVLMYTGLPNMKMRKKVFASLQQHKEKIILIILNNQVLSPVCLGGKDKEHSTANCRSLLKKWGH